MTGTPSDPGDVGPGDVGPDDADLDEPEPDQPEPRPAVVRRGEGPVIPDRSADDSDVGWSRDGADGADGADDADDERFLRDRPPHWS